VRSLRLATALIVAVAGCGSMANQRYRDVHIDADRAGGVVWMNGLEVGPAPQVLSAATDRGARFAVVWPDGASATCRVGTHVEPQWIFLDLLAFGLLGPAIDASTGRWRDLAFDHCRVRYPGV
jgi:hypothetical protein